MGYLLAIDAVMIKEFVNEWYPIVLAGLISFATLVGGLYFMYTKAMTIVQPILDKIQAFRDKDDETALANASLDTIKIDILKADLLAKIANTTVSPELTMVYQTQLDKLEAITSSATTIVDKVEDVSNTYL